MTRSLAVEVARVARRSAVTAAATASAAGGEESDGGVTVNLVAPGYIETEMTAGECGVQSTCLCGLLDVSTSLQRKIPPFSFLVHSAFGRCGGYPSHRLERRASRRDPRADAGGTARPATGRLRARGLPSVARRSIHHRSGHQRRRRARLTHFAERTSLTESGRKGTEAARRSSAEPFFFFFFFSFFFPRLN